MDLRARAVRGAHKVWLACELADRNERWSATATLARRVAPPGAGYRDAAPEAGATVEAPLQLAEDGDGIRARDAIRKTNMNPKPDERADSRAISLRPSSASVCIRHADV